MFLRNFDNCMVAHFTSYTNSSIFSNYKYNQYNGSIVLYTATSYNTSSTGDGYINERTMDGSIVIPRLGLDGSKITHIFFPWGAWITNFCFGDGDTPVTYEDYKLSGNPIDNKLTQVSRTTQYIGDNKTWRITFVGTYINSQDTDITIREWGIWKGTGGTEHTTQKQVSTDASSMVLVFREVLDEPIVIEAGTTATITLSYDIPMFNHP